MLAQKEFDAVFLLWVLNKYTQWDADPAQPPTQGRLWTDAESHIKSEWAALRILAETGYGVPGGADRFKAAVARLVELNYLLPYDEAAHFRRRMHPSRYLLTDAGRTAAQQLPDDWREWKALGG